MRKGLDVKKIAGIIFGVILLTVLIRVGHYYYATHSGGASVGFQEFAPSTLPPGLKVTDKSVTVWSEKGSLFGYHKQFVMNLNQRQSFISEQKNKVFTYTCDVHIINQTCVHETSPHHQPFLITTSYNQTDTSKPFIQNVSFVRGTTDIFINIQGSPVKTFDGTTWGKVVDSFKPVHYSGLPVKHYSPGP